MAKPSKAETLISKGRIKLLFNQPFFGMLVMKMRTIQTDAIATMGTDGRDLLFNPTFTEGLDKDELLGVLCHEVLHVAYGHHLRRGNRDPRLWNIACDYAINLVVYEAKMKLPASALYSLDFKGMSAEQIYKALEKEGQGGKGGGEQGTGSNDKGNGSGKIPTGDQWQIGGVEDLKDENGQPLSGEQLDKAEHENNVAVSEAVAAAQGKIPASMRHLIEDITRGKIRWDEELKRVFSNTLSADYTWARPNRRYVAQGMYLPGIVRDGVGEVVIGFDTSGSVFSPDVLSTFWGVMNDIVEQAKPERVHIVWCDARVQHVQSFEQGEELVPEARGGGGTDFRPVFRWVEQQGIEPQALIYITDMMGTFPDEAPDYPVIWAKSTDYQAPFGDEVRIDM